MSFYRFAFLLPLTAFYGAYLTKMLLLKRQGVQGNTLGKGSKPAKVKVVERLIQVITYTGAGIQYASVIIPRFAWARESRRLLWSVGFLLAWAGVVLFVAAVHQMKSNWRAGYTENQNTSLVTDGVYQLSRNPAFAGFDLLYIGCALAYPNILTILWSAAAVCVFHLQIRSEEEYLTAAFGQRYEEYSARVGRYFGRKQ